MANTEVILKKPVENLGVEGQTIKVRAGYARNWLLPNDLAILATVGNKKMIAALEQKRAERESQEQAAAQELVKKIERQALEFELVAAQGQDKVFGSITAQDIAAKLQEAGYSIDRKKVHLAKPIKDTGEHTVKIDLGHGVEASVTVKVVVPAAAESAESDEKKGKYSKGKKARAAKTDEPSEKKKAAKSEDDE